MKMKSILLLCITICCRSVYADELMNSLRPFFSFGAGAAVASNVGESKTFPIINESIDSLYEYTNHHATKTQPMIDSLVGIEYAYLPDWAVQFGLGYNQIANFSANGTLFQGADHQSSDQYSYHYNIWSSQLLAESKLLYTYHDRYHPYAQIGMGVAYNDADSYSTNVPPFLTFTREYNGNTQSSFSYLVGLGVDIDISSHLRAGGGYRFVDLGAVKLGNATINDLSAPGTLQQAHLYVSELIVQATWLF